MGKSKRKGQADDAKSPTTHSDKKMKKDEVDLLLEDNDGSPAVSPTDAELESDEIQINPFLLNPVLKVMMSQMKIADLKRSRGVCTLWDEYSTLELQKLTCQMKPLVLKEAGQLDKIVETFEESPNKVLLSDTIRSTLKVMASQEPSFFQTFQPKSLTIKTEEWDTEVNSKLLKILQNSSKHIKEFKVIGPLEHRQFGEEIKWPENFELPQLEELTLFNLLCDYINYDIEDTHFLIKNISNISPKLQSLKLYNHPSNHPLCDLLKSNGLIEKLQDLTLIYKKYDNDNDDDLVYSQDLLEMVQSGLKLSKFTIAVTFDEYQTQAHILGHFKKLNEFLTTQSDTLEELKICLDIHIDNKATTCKFNMPPLPKLKVLEIGNKDMHKVQHFFPYYYNNINLIPYNKMDLPLIFPNLKELTIEIHRDNFDNLDDIFKGSLEDVKKLTIRHPDQDSCANFKNYRLLETHFPHVAEFDVDHMNKYESNKQYNPIPWINTLKKLTLHPPKLEDLKLRSLSHLKGLVRLELINNGPSTLGKRFNFKAKTTVKSLKIQNYQINEKVLEEIRSRVTLDYTTEICN